MLGSPRNGGGRPNRWLKTVQGSVRAVPWPRGRIQPERIINMLYTIAVVLVILWLLGLVSSYTMGGFIHVLLVIAIVVILLEVIGGRKA